MKITKAQRKAVPLLIGLASPSGYGKTYSALLMAAGIAGEGGRVGFIDTEKGRGSMYADDADLQKFLPQGYDVIELEEPFTPAKYNEAIRAFSGYDVLIIDSGSHEWEGSGGCQDIAENNKLRNAPNWAKAKMEHKRFINCLTQASQHIIVCLRAREKTKPEMINGKLTMTEYGMQPICEKSFMFEMTISMMLEENHTIRLTKCPKPLLSLFSAGCALVTKGLGEQLREWASGGCEINKELRELVATIKDKAMLGTTAYEGYIKTLTETQKQALKEGQLGGFWSDCKYLCVEADNENKALQEEVAGEFGL
jgi:AAA domain